MDAALKVDLRFAGEVDAARLTATNLRILLMT
jgi:hypothetical protein